MQERVVRDSNASYTLLAALVTLSQVIIVAVLANYDKIHSNHFAMAGAAVASLTAISLWYPIDRRFVWAEKRRLARILMIEKEMKIYNQRLFDGDIDDSKVEEAIEEADRKSGIFAGISIHDWYLVLVVLMFVAWAFLVASSFTE